MSKTVYHLGQKIIALSNVLSVPVEDFLAPVGLSSYILTSKNGAIDATTLFKVWQGIDHYYANRQFPTETIMNFMGELGSPGLMAFRASPDIITGFQRMAILKRMEFPFRFEFTQSDRLFTMKITPECDAFKFTGFVATVEALLLLNMMRQQTGRPILPERISFPKQDYHNDDITNFVGVPIEHSEHLEISIKIEDARAPLISQNQAIWNNILNDRHKKDRSAPLIIQVEQVLVHLFPSGRSSIADVARELGKSTRTLQRELEIEQTKFSEILSNTRQIMASTYLENGEYSLPEISYLLAYSEPSAFSRAYKKWTGHTPVNQRK